MNIEVDPAHVRRVLLSDGWHAVEGTAGGSSFQLGALQLASGGADVGMGFSFTDHHTKKRLAGPIRALKALELDE